MDATANHFILLGCAKKKLCKLEKNIIDFYPYFNYIYYFLTYVT